LSGCVVAVVTKKKKKKNQKKKKKKKNAFCVTQTSVEMVRRIDKRQQSIELKYK
jgi:hypothetical protein